ncbi:MAG: Cysteine desulfurase [Frankiales bacterium]|nr:Cysteine desulfurase [Frankiales bacterium]
MEWDGTSVMDVPPPTPLNPSTSHRYGGYLDAAAGVPLHAVAAEALAAAAEDGWADPGRLTGPGRRSAVLLDAARESVATTLQVRADEVHFTPSGTHAIHLAVLGTLLGRRRAGDTLVHSAVEHSAVFKAADWHESHGGTVRVVGVDEAGRVHQDEFIRAATEPGVAAAVLQAANHEVGTRQPLESIGAALRAAGVPLIVDASHELVHGQAPTSPVFTADARLWGGPAGVGVLVVRRGTRWRNPFPSDEAESGYSPGTVAVPAIVAAAAALLATRKEAAEAAPRLSRFIDDIRARVPALMDDAVVLGDPVRRLPHLVTFSCLYVDGEALLTELDRRGIAVSSGSSCTSDTLTPSHVLVAMGALTSGNVRVSLPPWTSEADIEYFLRVLPGAVAAVRAQLPQPINHPAPRPETNAASPAPMRSGLTTSDIVDSRGRRCPLPILDLARYLPQVAVGAEVTVLADDPAAASDIAAWCRMQGQLLLSSIEQPDGSSAYLVRRIR